MRPAAALALLAAVLITGCSAPAAEPDAAGPVTAVATPPPAVGGGLGSPVPATPVATPPTGSPTPPAASTPPPPPTAAAAPARCRTADLAAVYLGGDATSLAPGVDTIERYRLTNTAAVPCRLGAWLGVTMVGVSGCPTPAGTPTLTPTVGPCPPGSPAPRGRTARSRAWPARDRDLAPGEGTVLSLLFADTYAPQSCADVWAPPDRLELRPAGDPQALTVPSKVYPCRGELLVAPLGFGL